MHCRNDILGITEYCIIVHYGNHYAKANVQGRQTEIVLQFAPVGGPAKLVRSAYAPRDKTSRSPGSQMRDALDS